MISNAQKLPFGQMFNRFGAAKSAEATHLLGKSPPLKVTKVVSSGIVQCTPVSSDPAFSGRTITMPVAMPEYVRYPIQVGDLGVGAAADFYLGGVDGLGGGTSGAANVGNLTCLYFHPLGNKGWTTVDNNALTLYGPNGVVLEDIGKKTVITLTPNGITITLQSGDNVMITGDLHVSGTVIAGYGGSDQVTLQQHVHDGVMVGGGDTTPPIAGT